MVAGLLLERDGDFAIVPWLEALHLACRGWLLHPLDHLRVRLSSVYVYVYVYVYVEEKGNSIV